MLPSSIFVGFEGDDPPNMDLGWYRDAARARGLQRQHIQYVVGRMSKTPARVARIGAIEKDNIVLMGDGPQGFRLPGANTHPVDDDGDESPWSVRRRRRLLHHERLTVVNLISAKRSK
jgi:hypothetical protein